MKFSQIKGNEPVLKAVCGMVDSGRVPHAIMFSEQDGGGAFPVALAFLQYLYCGHRSDGDSCGVCPSCNKIGKLIHPDVHFIFPTKAGAVSEMYMGKFRELAVSNPSFTEQQMMDALELDGKNVLIAVSEAKALLDTMSLSALEGGYRSAVVCLPEKMNPEASNKLLKLIEEPPEMTQFVLITHAPEKVLQTIASRCQRIHVQPEAGPAVASFPEPELFGEYFNALRSHDLFTALDFTENLVSSFQSRESAKAFCKFATARLRDVFLLQQGMGQLAADAASVREFVPCCRKSFARNASASFDRAYRLIDRNVGMKIIFTDLTDRLFNMI